MESRTTSFILSVSRMHSKSSTYDVTFTLNGLTEGMLSLTDSTSVEQIDDTDSKPAVYYDMQGRRVAHPSSGLYIEKKGSKVTKKMIR